MPITSLNDLEKYIVLTEEEKDEIIKLLKDFLDK